MDSSGILHAAYTLTWTGTGEHQMVQRLLELFPGILPETARYAVRLAWDLRDASVSVAIAQGCGIMEEEEALDTLRRRCYGFSYATYRMALQMAVAGGHKA